MNEHNDWYAAQMAGELSDSNPFPDFFYRGCARSLCARPRAEDSHAAGLWIGAFMDCLLERRGYSLVKHRPTVFDPNEMLSTPGGLL